MPELTLIEAINLALARAMQEDANVVVLGEDVGVNGGVFRATVGLQQRFGAERVIDTPLAELLISGLCVGMAAQGLKPVGEIQFMGFIYPALDQVINHAGRLRNRTRGRLSCPLVPAIWPVYVSVSRRSILPRRITGLGTAGAWTIRVSEQG